MKYNELTLSKQTTKRSVGRGIAAGRGKTAGRGTKGQGSRKSGGVRPGFEGGQMPLYMRIPKLRGFKSHRAEREVVYTGQLEQVKKSVVDSTALFEAGIISSPHASVKLLLNGELKSKKDVELQSVSKSAEAAIKKAGGSFTRTEQLARLAKKAEK